MQVLIRKIEKQDEQIQSQLDHIVEVNQLDIGRGTDQDLLLSDPHVALKHAVIIKLQQNYQIQTKSISGIKVNGVLTKLSRINVGDNIQVGDHLLQILEPTQFDVELAISVESLGKRETIELSEQQFKTTLKKTYIFNKRLAAWGLFLGLGLVTLLMPLTHVFQSDNQQQSDIVQSAVGRSVDEVGASKQQGIKNKLLSFLPDDSAWLAGKLHKGHSFMGDTCDNCHKKPFETVTDNACMSCHQDIKQHRQNHTDLPQLNTETCAFCHREHEETTTLVRQDEQNCASCHAELKVKHPSVKIDDASDFGKHHPEFKYSLLKPTQSDDKVTWLIQRFAVGSSDLFETNQLKFSHQKHLEPAGIQNQTGAKEVLDCQSCHQPQLDGGIMQPISMEKNCSRCHRMEFDPTNPNRELPHGDPELILLTLKEYYSRKYLADLTDQTDRAAQVRAIRKPGVSAKASDSELKGLALTWANQQAEKVAEDIIERRACATCHQVDVIADAKSFEQRWKIQPIQINANWLPKANFNHQKHQTMQCLDCHNAQESEYSSDILMPKIATCRSCHTGQNETSKLASTCVMCHGFHIQASTEKSPSTDIETQK
jgi:pSer/pThr/pTyr-binding forkhead associated (FHA) protein